MTIRMLFRWLLATIFLVAGILHLAVTEPFMDIAPNWVPYGRQVILLTGLAEIAGAVGLIIPRARKAAGIGLALYAICVFPANIHHAQIDLDRAQPLLGWAYHGPRLLFQPVIVWWALWVGEVIDWPFWRRA
ncbi:hypothetical protein BZG35_15955 [Brevundimonas sp. LM2]|uniref:DoxX family protein n=1 Tax=Brevundimonas sp. LM2 TaxID=1938605 RepID=UPI000983DFF6|nr:DoxX family protein [Brevundimonas sp. LM2]AQR62983.1 hypothetical protein BZG35_15955 [Brevundimonas sp. LM2]